MSNYIRDLKYQAEVSEAQRQDAEKGIIDLMAYLNSDKFACGNELDGYVNINDVLDRLTAIRQSLYKDGEEFGIEADPEIIFKRVNRRDDILVEFEIVHDDGFNQNIIGRIGQVLTPEAQDYYDAKHGVHVIELFSAPGVGGEVFRCPNMTKARELARDKAIRHARNLIEMKQLNS